MATLTTLLSIAIDLAIKYTVKLRLYLAFDLDMGFMPSFAIWTGMILFFTMIAASVGAFISKDAEGSGIPEMKSILSGVNIYRYLSFQTVIGKIIGLYSGFAAGLHIGKEGPFVHLAGGITNKLSKLRPFREIKNNHSLRKQMLTASVAVGVTSSFGAPIGGTLFSIEVTSTYYFVSNLWKTFFCACVSIMVLKLFDTYNLTEIIFPVNKEPFEVEHGWQYIFYGLLGVC
jgi:chloride channel 2